MLGNHGICTSENHDLLAWLALHQSMLHGGLSRTSDTSIWREEMDQAMSRRGDYSVEGLIGETPERRLASLVGNLSFVREFELAVDFMGVESTIPFNATIENFADLSSCNDNALILSFQALQACKQLPDDRVAVVTPTDDDLSKIDLDPTISTLFLLPWDNMWTCVLWDHKKPGNECTVAPNTSIPRSDELQAAIKAYMAYMAYMAYRARKKLDENGMEVDENTTEIEENAMDIDENQPEVPEEFLNALKDSSRKAAGGPKAMCEACQIFKSSLKFDDEWSFAIWTLEQIDKRFPNELELCPLELASEELQRITGGNVLPVASDRSSESSQESSQESSSSGSDDE
ncbi:hypothetical protein AA0113_g2708 [Alternaria arborescens]|uniref:Uncharacterized protein n=1 Tax=Alternaria arborescens TaxID=156630 RepID=A0A4Q4SLH9_9PLEO|nr:hypothetical protein AA0112_g697 [Alternaria arborescens]RYO71026.1 hypothetical protein AA0113_g2708 [Alternaria arborescens]